MAILSGLPDRASTLARRLKRLQHGPVVAIGPLDDVPGVDTYAVDRSRDIEEPLRRFQPDLIVSWAFPWRVPESCLGLPPLGSVNFHPSLLPRHRGPNPIGWTIRAGDTVTGVTWHRMVPAFDEGPILAQAEVELAPDEDPTSIMLRLLRAGLDLLPHVLSEVGAGASGRPQAALGATTAPYFEPEYAILDWSRPARFLHDQVRAWALSPRRGGDRRPVGWIGDRQVEVLRTSVEQQPGALRVECADGPLWIVESD